MLTYKKVQLCKKELNKHFNQSISIIGEQSGLYVLVKVHLNRSEEWLIERASTYGVKVYPTSIYYIKEQSEPAMIKVGFSNLSCEEIQVGVELLKKTWT